MRILIDCFFAVFVSLFSFAMPIPAVSPRRGIPDAAFGRCYTLLVPAEFKLESHSLGINPSLDLFMDMYGADLKPVMSGVTLRIDHKNKCIHVEKVGVGSASKSVLCSLVGRGYVIGLDLSMISHVFGNVPPDKSDAFMKFCSLAWYINLPLIVFFVLSVLNNFSGGRRSVLQRLVGDNNLIVGGLVSLSGTALATLSIMSTMKAYTVDNFPKSIVDLRVLKILPYYLECYGLLMGVVAWGASLTNSKQGVVVSLWAGAMVCMLQHMLMRDAHGLLSGWIKMLEIGGRFSDLWDLGNIMCYVKWFLLLLIGEAMWSTYGSTIQNVMVGNPIWTTVGTLLVLGVIITYDTVV